MKNKKYFVLFSIALLLVVISLSMILSNQICLEEKTQSGEFEDSNVIVLGFSQMGDESSWRTTHTKSVIQAAQQSGIQLIFKNAQQKQENQINAIRSFIASKVDVIAFTPIVEDGWDDVLLEAKQANIPVILSDRRIETKIPSLYAAFVGTDIELEGRLAGEFLIRKYGKKPTKIIEIAGTESSTSAKQRAKGIRQAIAGYPNFEIVFSKSGDFLRSKGAEVTREGIQLYPDADVILCHNDSMALGAVEAIEEKGLNPGKDICVVSFDGEKDAIQALKEGKLNCVVECSPLLGEAIMECASALATSEPYRPIVYQPTRVFSEYDNISEIQSWEDE